MNRTSNTTSGLGPALQTLALNLTTDTLSLRVSATVVLVGHRLIARSRMISSLPSGRRSRAREPGLLITRGVSGNGRYASRVSHQVIRHLRLMVRTPRSQRDSMGSTPIGATVIPLTLCRVRGMSFEYAHHMKGRMPWLTPQPTASDPARVARRTVVSAAT